MPYPVNPTSASIEGHTPPSADNAFWLQELAQDGDPAVDADTYARILQHAVMAYHREPHPGLGKPSIERTWLRVRDALETHGIRLDGRAA